MKDKIRIFLSRLVFDVLAWPVAILLGWTIGLVASIWVSPSYLAGKGIFNLTIGLWVLSVVFSFAFLCEAKFGRHDLLEALSDYVRLVLLAVMFFCLLIPMDRLVDFQYVQRVENPRVQQKAVDILSDPVKIATLRDFYAGKIVPEKDAWFMGNPRDFPWNSMAVSRILGLSQEETEDFFNRGSTRELYRLIGAVQESK